jgi:Phage integrase, N-terminal SAM-like domain
MTPLRQRMLEDMQVRNLSPHTQESYVQRVSQFARHFGKSPERLGSAAIRTSEEGLARRGRDPGAEGATEAARGAQPRGGPPVSRRCREPEASHHPDACASPRRLR